MKERIWLFFQYVVPGYTLEYFSKKIGDSSIKWFKSMLIRRFIKKYKIDLSRLKNQNLASYPTFNSFFIRELNDRAKGLSKKNEISSPAESAITEFGFLEEDTMIQAKNHFFTLEELLHQEKKYISLFDNGEYMIFFLDLYNYHRYHMPFDGKLEYSIYIPSSSFDLDYTSQKNIPKLYCRNERYITFFDTAVGKMGIVMIGALFIGGIQTSWMKHPFKSRRIIKKQHSNIFLKKDEELGLFKCGSTIILLFEKNHITWNKNLKKGMKLKVSEAIAKKGRKEAN